MTETISFSRYKLTTFLACQRRFQLRYLQQLAWPVAPQEEKWREASERGEQFHRLLERHFLDLAVAEGEIEDREVRRWWRIFRANGPDLPAGKRLPELTLTVPVAGHLLTGRYDLLVLGEAGAHIFDWKTEARPRPGHELRADWQTRLYLALLAEGGAALERAPIAPEAIALTYWFVHDPDATVTIRYSDAEHTANWEAITGLIGRIDDKLAGGETWPLTDDLSECARCVYRVFCGRQDVAPAGERAAWEAPEAAEAPPLAPDLP